jgi:hypothetical protein
MPPDSAVARSYTGYSIRPGEKTQRIREGIDQLHTEYQAIIRAATRAQVGASADQKAAAQKLIDDAKRQDANLLAIAGQDQGFPLTAEQSNIAARGAAGTGQGASVGSGAGPTDNLPEATGVVAQSAAASGTGSSDVAEGAGVGSASANAPSSSAAADPTAALAEATQLSRKASERAGDLASMARDDTRPLLASFLDQAKRTLEANGR